MGKKGEKKVGNGKKTAPVADAANVAAEYGAPAGADADAIGAKVASPAIRKYKYAARESLTYAYDRKSAKQRNCCFRGCFLGDDPADVLAGFVVFAGSWTCEDSECDPEILSERRRAESAGVLVGRVLATDLFFESSSLAKAFFFGKKGGGNSGLRREIDGEKLTRISGLVRSPYRNVKTPGETFVLDAHLDLFMADWRDDWRKTFDRKTVAANAKKAKAASSAKGAKANAAAKTAPKAGSSKSPKTGASKGSKSTVSAKGAKKTVVTNVTRTNSKPGSGKRS